MIDRQNARCLLNLGLLLGLGYLHHLHVKSHVFRHRQVRIERIALEHHGDVAVGRIQIVDLLFIQQDRAFRQAVQPGQQAQQRGLAAA